MIRVTECARAENGRLKVSFDNGVSCLLYRGEAASMHLEAEAVLTEEAYRGLMEEILGKRAKKRAMYLLQQMDRTEHQLREKLSQNGYPPECVDGAVDYLKGFHYLDDLRYACSYVRCHQEKLSRQQLRMKLLQKGVSSEEIRLALEQEFEMDETGQVLTLMEKRHYDPSAADEREKKRMYSFLLRRGFSLRDAQRAENLLTDRRGEKYF